MVFSFLSNEIIAKMSGQPVRLVEVKVTQESRDCNRLMMSCVSKLLLSVSITDKNKIDHVQLEEELQIFSLSSVLFNYKDLEIVVS